MFWKKTTSTTIVIKLGGSIVSPTKGDIDSTFLKEFRTAIEALVSHGHKIAVITGGGKTCRSYQEAAREINPSVRKDDLDWIGIFTNNLHGQVLRASFDPAITHPTVITKIKDVQSVTAPLVIIGAEEPGHSANYPSVQVAEYTGATEIINLSNVEYIYDSDPRENPQAKRFDEVTWEQYLNFIPTEWTPGLNTPFDPVASRRAKELGLSVVFMKGHDLESLQNHLKGRPFVGSIIHS